MGLESAPPPTDCALSSPPPPSHANFCGLEPPTLASDVMCVLKNKQHARTGLKMEAAWSTAGVWWQCGVYRNERSVNKSGEKGARRANK